MIMKLKTALKVATTQALVIALGFAGANLSVASARNKSATMPQPPCCDANATQQSAVEQSMRNKSGKIDPPPVDRVAQPPVEGGATPPSAEYGVDRQILEKPPRDPAVTERRAHSGPGGTPPTAVARNKTVWWIPTAAGLAAVGGILAATGGGTPVSR
jgi:hypothetical protein